MTNSIIHQKGCPYSDIDLEHTASDANGTGDAKVEHRVCPEHRCCVWQDLHTWFGFKDAELKRKDFHFFFTDIGHGGSGVYEKFIVSGQKTLEVFSEAYIKNKFEPIGIPRDLLEDPLISEKVCQKVWTLKRVERLLSSRCISSFARAYLAVAQILATDILCVKYVKACIGYSCHLTADNPELIVEWLPSLIEHMYFLLKLDTEDREEDNELLLDIQEYFDYPYTALTPRIKEIISAPFNYVDASRGENLIRQFSEEYFLSLANEAFNNTIDKQKWTRNELEFFMKSPALQLFSACWLSLPAYFARDQNFLSLPHSMEYRKLCGLILEACYDLTTPEDAQVWIIGFIHRLRQIQIILELNKSCENNETSNMFYFNKEILRCDNQTHEPIGHLTCDNDKRDDKESRPFEERNLQTNVTKQQTCCKTNTKNLNMEGCKTIICTLGNMLIKYLTCSSPPKPGPIIATGANGKLFELKPLYSFYKHNSPRPYLTGSKNYQEVQYKRNLDAGNTRHQNVNVAKDFLKNENMDQKNKTPFNESVFTRNTASIQKYQTQHNNKSNEQFQKRCLWSCKKNLWNKKFFDKEGVELWRPPAAIFMQKRRKSSYNAPKEININRQTIYENSPLLRKKMEPNDEGFFIETPSNENDFIENEVTTLDHDEEISEDNIKLKIRYILPDKSEPEACNVPLNNKDHSNMDDKKINRDGLSRTVIECDSDLCESESSNKTFCKEHCCRVLYSDSDDSCDEVNDNLVPTESTESPCVYIKGKKHKKFKGHTNSTVKREAECCCDSSSRNSYCSCDSETESLHETGSVISDYSNCCCCCCCCCSDLDNGRINDTEKEDQIMSNQICDCNRASLIFKYPKNSDTRSSLSSASTDSCKKCASRSNKALKSIRKCISKLNNALSNSCTQESPSTSKTYNDIESTLVEGNLGTCSSENRNDLLLHSKTNALFGLEENRSASVPTRINCDPCLYKIRKRNSLNNLKLATVEKYKDISKKPTSVNSTKPSMSRSSPVSTFASSGNSASDSSRTEVLDCSIKQASDTPRITTSDSSRITTSNSSRTTTSDSSRTTTSDSSRTTTSDSSQTSNFDSSRTSTFDSSRTSTSDSSRISSFDSSRTSSFDSSRTSTLDSSRKSTFDSSRTSSFDSSPTATSNSSPTATSNSSQTTTSNSSQTATSNSSQTATSNSSQTATSNSSQTATSNSSQTPTSDSSQTPTSNSLQTETSDSSLTETLNSSSQQTTTALSDSSVMSKDSAQITSSGCSQQSVVQRKCVCNNCDYSSINSILGHYRPCSQSNTCGMAGNVFFSNQSTFDKTSSLSSQGSESLNSLKHTSTNSETDSFSTSTSTTSMSSYATLSSSSSISDLPRKHRELLNHCRKLSREISGIVSKFDKEKQFKSPISSKFTSKTDTDFSRLSNTSNVSQSNIASNQVRSQYKKYADTENFTSNNDLGLKPSGESFCPLYEKSFQNLPDIFPTLYGQSEKKKPDSIDSDTTDLYSVHTRNTGSLAPLDNTKKDLQSKFVIPSYVNYEKKKFTKEYRGLRAVYHDAPSVFVFK